MNSSRDDLLTKLNSEIYLQRLVKNKDESMNFDESGIVAAANYLCGKGEMTRVFFYLVPTQKTTVWQMLFNKVMINHALLSSII